MAEVQEREKDSVLSNWEKDLCSKKGFGRVYEQSQNRKKEGDMIDFIKLHKELDKDEVLFTDNLGWLKTDKKGCHYLLTGEFTHLNVRYDVDNSFVEISGSLMYYMQGHNFTFSRQAFIDAVKIIGNKLHLNLWDASVTELEFGIIMEIEEKPETYINSHHAKKEEKLTEDSKQRDNGHFKWWNDRNVSIKMYDARRNLMKKVPKQIRNGIEDFNPESKYLKFEVHYKQPHIVLNRGKDIKLNSLILPAWTDRLKEDLLLQYGRLLSISRLIPPQDKKEALTANWLLRGLIQSGLLQGKSPESTKRTLYEILKSYNVLNPDDRKARQRQFRKANRLIGYESYNLMDKIILAFSLHEQWYK